MQWEVRLSGDEFDLRKLAEALVKDDLRISERDGHYYLASTQFDEMKSCEEVSAAALEELKILTGIVKQLYCCRTPLGICGVAIVQEDGKRKHFGRFDVVAHARVTIKANVQRKDGSVMEVSDSEQISDMKDLASHDDEVARALRLWGAEEQHDWVSLYRLYEVIEKNAGDAIFEEEWATKNSIRRFKHTANSVEAVGDAARHGSEETQPPPQPMLLSEAEALIKYILGNWLDRKAAH